MCRPFPRSLISILPICPAAEKVRHDGHVGCRILSCSTALKRASFHMHPFRSIKRVFSFGTRNLFRSAYFMAINSSNHSGRALGGNSFILGNRLFRLWRALPSRFQSFPQIIQPSNARRLTTCGRAPRSQVSQNALVRPFLSVFL